MVRLGVLVSGSGTILEAMLDAGLAIALVASDRPCRGLEVAKSHGVEALLLDRREYGGFRASFDRDRYSRALSALLLEHDINLIAMAGFGTVTAPSFYDDFAGRVLNTHPSLLPAFKGWHAVDDALAAGVRVSGCTVHVATEELDDGPVLAQRKVAVLDGDDRDTLHERIKEVERTLYPLVVGRVMAALAQGLEPRSVAESGES